MKPKIILKNIASELHKSKDRHITHEKIKGHLEELCKDMDFIHSAIKDCISDPIILNQANNLFFYLLVSGDVIIAINLYPPIADGAENITHDNIHHHGWRLLTSGVISGEGYETIKFVKKSHENVTNNCINLKVDEIYKHTLGKTKFVDSYQTHVVFHPKSTTATLALWSSEKPLMNQKVKLYLKNFSSVRKILSKIVHASGLNKPFGLNQIKGVYFHPENGKIVMTKNYSKPIDGPREEILPCMFKFFQQINLKDSSFFSNVKKFAPIEAKKLCDMLISEEPIPVNGIKGNIRRRFSKSEILSSLNN